MHNLIMKDVLIQKRILPYLILYIPFVVFINGKFNSNTLYIIISLTITFMLSSNSFALDEVSQSSKVIVSLPVSRKEVVLSKYLSIFLYIVFAIILTSAAGVIFTLFGARNTRLNYITISEIKSIAVSCTLVSCIIFPLQFKLGYAKARIATIMVYIMLFSAVPILMYKLNNVTINDLISLPEFLTSSAGTWLWAALLALIWLTSYFMSINFFEKREL